MSRVFANDPRDFQFDLPTGRRPDPIVLRETWYPGARDAWPGATSRRIYDPALGVRAIVIHATAGASSAGAFSVMAAGKASFHWLAPAENEAAHGHHVLATAPETRAAWHVRNDRQHEDVWNGKRKINHFSLGIEIVNTMQASDPFSNWQIEATAEIIRYAWAKYPNLRHVVSHAKLDPTRRSDPGAHFPWAKLRAAVLERPLQETRCTAAAEIAPDTGTGCRP